MSEDKDNEFTVGEAPDKILTIKNNPDIGYTVPPTRNITFHDDEKGQVGELNWDDGVMKFIGDAQESAQIFFDHIIRLACICDCQNCEKGNTSD